MNKIILVLVLFGLASATAFDMVSSSICTVTHNVTNFCMRWQQNGTIQEQIGSCFSAHVRLLTKEGLFKTMGELKVGDEVLARDAGVDVFTRVEGWLHRETQGYSPYLNIHYHDGALSVSRKHNIAVDEHDYHFAEDLLGKSLFGLTLTVTQLSETIAQGKYSPRTSSSNYYVYFNSKGDNKVLAHNFAHIRNPQRYESIVNMIVRVWSMLESSNPNEAHPCYAWLQSTFSFLLE